jgi:hypothetical protein
MITCVIPHPAAAMLPPLPPPSYAAYGPALVCDQGFSIEVKSHEAVLIVGQSVKVINQKYWFMVEQKAMNGASSAQMSGPQRRISNDFLARRRNVTGGEASPIQYIIQASALEGQPYELVMSSSAFGGHDDDKDVLARVHQPVAKAGECIAPGAALDVARGAQTPQHVVRVAHQLAATYPKEPTLAPRFHCQSGLGFALETGEHIRRPWNSLGNMPFAPSYVQRDGITIEIKSPDMSLARVDPKDRREHPMSLLQKSEITYYPSRGVGPPYAAAGIRETGSWQVELGAKNYRRFQVNFPAGITSSLGFAFLERLEFVDSEDPRCLRND